MEIASCRAELLATRTSLEKSLAEKASVHVRNPSAVNQPSLMEVKKAYTLHLMEYTKKCQHRETIFAKGDKS